MSQYMIVTARKTDNNDFIAQFTCGAYAGPGGAETAVTRLTGAGRVKGRAALSRALTAALTGGEPTPADVREVARTMGLTVTVAPAPPAPRESYGVIMHRAPALPVY